MPVPGETIYSDDWMNRNGEQYSIPENARPFCRAICRDLGMGSDKDMLAVWLIITENPEHAINAFLSACKEDEYR